MNTRISRVNREIPSTNGKIAHWRALPPFPNKILKQFLNSQIKKKLYSFTVNNLLKRTKNYNYNCHDFKRVTCKA